MKLQLSTKCMATNLNAFESELDGKESIVLEKQKVWNREFSKRTGIFFISSRSGF